MDFLEDGWRKPDDGIWEVRGPQRNFTHSKVMAWVAVDRAIKTVENCRSEGPVDRWRALRQEIHTQVTTQGFNTEKGSFTQYYGSDQLDASLLMIPMVGFLPPSDPRVRGTIEAIERELLDGGFVLRYQAASAGAVDGLSGREGAFLACSFWLSDCLSMIGRQHDARQLFDRLLEVRNDLGLLSEEYDPVAGRLVGNFPQAFSHVSLVNTASKLAGEAKPVIEPQVMSQTRRGMTKSKTGSGRLHRLGQPSHHRLRRGAVGTPVLPADTTASQDASDGSMAAGGTSAAKDAGTDYSN
jgi:GH15 family glucan-1,4-alpha-glucosidase